MSISNIVFDIKKFEVSKNAMELEVFSCLYPKEIAKISRTCKKFYFCSQYLKQSYAKKLENHEEFASFSAKWVFEAALFSGPLLKIYDLSLHKWSFTKNKYQKVYHYYPNRQIKRNHSSMLTVGTKNSLLTIETKNDVYLSVIHELKELKRVIESNQSDLANFLINYHSIRVVELPTDQLVPTLRFGQEDFLSIFLFKVKSENSLSRPSIRNLKKLDLRYSDLWKNEDVNSSVLDFLKTTSLRLDTFKFSGDIGEKQIENLLTTDFFSHVKSISIVTDKGISNKLEILNRCFPNLKKLSITNSSKNVENNFKQIEKDSKLFPKLFRLKYKILVENGNSKNIKLNSTIELSKRRPSLHIKFTRTKDLLFCGNYADYSNKHLEKKHSTCLLN